MKVAFICGLRLALEQILMGILSNFFVSIFEINLYYCDIFQSCIFDSDDWGIFRSHAKARAAADCEFF